MDKKMGNDRETFIRDLRFSAILENQMDRNAEKS